MFNFMFNFKRLLPSSLLPLTVLAIPQGLVVPRAIAQGGVSPIAQTPLSWQGVVNSILSNKEPEPREPRAPGSGRSGGSRPANLCWITPTDTVWNSRPQLVWLGNFRAVGVRLEGTETLLWRSVAPAGNRLHRLEYGGTPLEPGKTYEWVFFFNGNSTSPMQRVPFQIVDANQQTAINTDLAKLDAESQTQKYSVETMALHRANFFAQRQLKADALQEVFSVKNPSAQLQQVAQDIEAEICQSK